MPDKNENVNLKMNFDELLRNLGEFGKYQRKIYFLLFIPTIFSAMQNLAWVFLGATVHHRCLLPEEVGEAEVFEMPDGLKSKLILSRDNTTFDNCHYLNDGNSTYCDNGWVYDKSTFGSSAVMEWNLVCDNRSLRATAQSVYMFGVLLGSYIFGFLSDRFGRKPVFLLSIILQFLSGLGAGMAPEYYSFILFR